MKYLNIVSVFPALTETFVYREIQSARRHGCEVVIAQLRDLNGPSASGFDDLRSTVVKARLWSASVLLGTFYFTGRKPRLWLGFLRMVLGSFPDTVSALKLAYILTVSIGLAYRLRNSGISHVRGHHLHSEAVASMFIGGLLELPYNFTCHTVKTYYPRGVIRETIRRASFVLANIDQVKRFLIEQGADPGRVHLVRGGVSLPAFPLHDAEPREDPSVILAVGRFDAKKGFDVLLSACSILRDRKVRFRCVLIGDGDEWGELVAMRRATGLEAHVQMPGSLTFDKVRQWHRRAALLAVPSVLAADGSTDGLPTVIIEAFACGVPVIGSAVGGIPDAIQDRVNGFLVKPGDADELANRIEVLLKDRELRLKFVHEARRTAECEFDLDRNVQSLIGLMQDSQTGLIQGGARLLPPAPQPIREAR